MYSLNQEQSENMNNLLPSYPADVICVQVNLGKVIRKSANLAVGGGKSAEERERERERERQTDRQTDRKYDSCRANSRHD